MSSKPVIYPRLTFHILWLMQTISSAVVLVFFYVTWSNVYSSPVLLGDLQTVESGDSITEWHAPWFFILVTSSLKDSCFY